MKQLHPLTTQALDYLFMLQRKQPVDPAAVKTCYESACDIIPRELLRAEFMPVMNQIWKVV